MHIKNLWLESCTQKIYQSCVIHYLYIRLNNFNGIVFQEIKYIDISHAIMFGTRLRNMLTKITHEFKSLFVINHKMRSKWLNLLLFCAPISQRRIITAKLYWWKTTCGIHRDIYNSLNRLWIKFLVSLLKWLFADRNSWRSINSITILIIETLRNVMILLEAHFMWKSW